MNKFYTVYLSIIILFSQYASADILQSIKNKKLLTVCSESGYAPFEIKSTTNKWLGFDVEMMQSYARSIDVKLLILDTKWDGIIPSLLSGKCEAIASAMAITKERALMVKFSDPYYKNHFAIAMKNTAKNKKNYQNFSDLNKSNIKIAVKTGSSADLFIQNSKKFVYATILKYDADADTIGAVLNSKADAFMYDVPYVKLAFEHYPEKLYIIVDENDADSFAVAFRLQDQALRASFNNFLRIWQKSAAYNAAIKNYFTPSSWNIMLNKVQVNSNAR